MTEDESGVGMVSWQLREANKNKKEWQDRLKLRTKNLGRWRGDIAVCVSTPL